MDNNIHYFDKQLKRQFILSNEIEGASPFYEAPLEESLDLKYTFEFVAPADNPKTARLSEGGYVGVFDEWGDFQLFEITRIEEEDGEEGLNRHVFSSYILDELDSLDITDKRPTDATAEKALTDLLSNQNKFKVGNVADLGIFSTNFYYETLKSGLKKIIETWGGEVKLRIELVDGEIGGFYIDILTRLGSDTGQRVEIDRNADKITRTVDFDKIRTAIYPRGKGSETEAGGYTRKLTIANVEWSVANGDPINKPLGQEWIGDENARLEHGIPDGNGGKLHKKAFIDIETEDENELIQAGYEALLEKLEPLVNYGGSIQDFGLINPKLGDTVPFIDYNFIPALAIEARLIKIKRYKDDPENGEIEAGNFLPVFTSQANEIEQIKQTITDNQGTWESGGGPITDEDFIDTMPATPTNLTAEGLFKTIILSWDYNNASYIANYEVYGSKVPGFVPDNSNLLFRGKTSGFAHDAAVNEQWYYKIRAVNTHDTASPFSTEVSAQTVQVQNIDIAIGAVNTEKLADLAVEAEKLANLSVGTDKILDDAIQAAKLAANAVTELKIANGAISNPKLADLAVTAGKLANGAVTNPKIFDGAITETKLANLSISAGKLKDGIIDDTKLANLAVTAGKLANGAVTDLKIFDGAVTVDKLANLAVDASKLADSAVTSTKLANLAVGTAAIANLAVTNGKIASLAVDSLKVADAAITSGKIQDLAVGNAAIANAAITSGKIQDLAVGTAAIANLAVTNGKIANLAVDTAQLNNAAITEAKIANLAVGTAAIQDLAVSNAKIKDIIADKITAGTLNVAANQIALGTDFREAPDLIHITNGLTIGTSHNGSGDYLNLVQSTTTEKYAYTKRFQLVPGSQITISYEFYRDGNNAGGDVFLLASDEVLTETNKNVTSYEHVYNAKANGSASNWVRVVKTFNIVATARSGVLRFDHDGSTDTAPSSIRFRNVMVNYGNIALSWQPHTDEDISIGAITAKKMVAGTITAASGVIADAAITAAKIANLAVGNAAIANGAITNAKIANLAVDTGQIQNLAVTNAKIASLAVDNAKIANAAITNAKIADLSVTNSKIANATIESAKIKSLDAGKINATSLSAITATLGDVTAGTLNAVDITGSRITTEYDSNAAYPGIAIIESGTIDVARALDYGAHGIKMFNGELKFGTWSGLSFTTKATYSQNAINSSDEFIINSPQLSLTGGNVIQFQDGPSLDTTGGVFRTRANATNYSGINTGQYYMYLDNDLFFNMYHEGTSKNKVIGMGNISIKGLNTSLVAMQVRNGADTAYAAIHASDFVTNSDPATKQNINPYAVSVLEGIKNTEVYTFVRTDTQYEDIQNRYHLGFMNNEVPFFLKRNDGIDLGATTAWLTKGMKEIIDEKEAQAQQIKEIVAEKETQAQQIKDLLARVLELESKIAI